MSIAINLAGIAAISDYTTLFAKVKLWLDRDDLDTYIPTFISLAESYINRELRTPEMEASIPVVTTGASFALPLDFLQMRGLTSNKRALTAMSAELAIDTYGTETGWPEAYYISGRTVNLVPAPTRVPSLTLAYWQAISPLSANLPSNWLLSSHPDVYLFGVLAFAYDYIDSPDDVQKYTALFQGAVQAVSAVGMKARWGGPIKARATTQVRGVRA